MELPTFEQAKERARAELIKLFANTIKPFDNFTKADQDLLILAFTKGYITGSEETLLHNTHD